MVRNRSRRKLALILIALAGVGAVLLAACGGASPELVVEEAFVEREAALPYGAPAATAVPAPMEAPAAEEGYLLEPSAGGLGTQAERMIMRSADVAVVVENTETALEQIRGVAAALDGYVASTNLWRSDGQLRGTVTIRVPAESFDMAMDQIKGLALEVERETVGSQDVTEEYTDLSARLRNLEATEQELLALLTEVRQETRRAEDVLSVHRELSNIRGQIEQVKGRMQYLSGLTDLATINLELIPEEEQPILEAGWKPLSTARTALNALVNASQLLVDLVIWVVLFVLPVLVVLLAPLVLIVFLLRRWRRRRSNRQAS